MIVHHRLCVCGECLVVNVSIRNRSHWKSLGTVCDWADAPSLASWQLHWRYTSHMLNHVLVSVIKSCSQQNQYARSISVGLLASHCRWAMAYSFSCNYSLVRLVPPHTHTTHAHINDVTLNRNEYFFPLIATKMDPTAVRMAFSLFNSHALECGRLMRDAKRVGLWLICLWYWYAVTWQESILIILLSSWLQTRQSTSTSYIEENFTISILYAFIQYQSNSPMRCYAKSGWFCDPELNWPINAVALFAGRIFAIWKIGI